MNFTVCCKIGIECPFINNYVDINKQDMEEMSFMDDLIHLRYILHMKDTIREKHNESQECRSLQ